MLAHSKDIFNFVCVPLSLGLSTGLFTWMPVMVHTFWGPEEEKVRSLGQFYDFKEIL